MALIRSGSHVAGVDPVAFGLPAGTAIRYERPADELVPLLSSYAVLDSDPTIWNGAHNWLPPSWAQIWIVLTHGQITVKVGRSRYNPLASAILYGPTSRFMPVTAQGGVTVVIDVSPVGWARLFAASAEAKRDLVTPLAEMLPTDLAASLATALHRSDHDLAVKGIIDELMLRHLPPPHPDEPLIAAVMTMLANDDGGDLATMAERLGFTPAMLRRISKRYFGFTPKLLQMRVRFMRAIAAMVMAPEKVDFHAVPRGYVNVPHFIRDANLFIGMTPRRFLAMDMPYLRAAFRARQMVLGSPTPSLDVADLS